MTRKSVRYARNARRVDPRRRGVAATLTKMRQGASLRLSQGRNGRAWFLSDNTRVADDVAAVVIAHPSVTGVGDCLFGDRVPSLSQTFRYVES
jgi:hypothetical protein